MKRKPNGDSPASKKRPGPNPRYDVLFASRKSCTIEAAKWGMTAEKLKRALAYRAWRLNISERITLQVSACQRKVILGWLPAPRIRRFVRGRCRTA